jgi:hypothetical protein
MSRERSPAEYHPTRTVRPDNCAQLTERELRDVVGGSDRALLGRFECC